MHHFNDLQPEETGHPDIVRELRTIYQLKPEEQQALEHVRKQLTHSASFATNLDVVHLDERELPMPIEELPRVTPLDARRVNHTHKIAGKMQVDWLRPFNALVAVLVCCVLVGLLAFLFSTIHHNQTTVGSSSNTQGISFLLAPAQNGAAPSQAVLSVTRDILQQRFNDFGLNGASVVLVTTNGQPRFAVNLPHFSGNEQQTINTLVGTGKLEFWITGTNPLNVDTTFDPAQYTQYNPENKPEFTGTDLDPKSLSVSPGSPNGNVYQINFAMLHSKAVAFGTFTSKHINQVMTITLDRKVLVSATIQNTIAGPGEMTGNYTQQQAQAIVTALKTGKLPISLQLLKTSTSPAS